MKSIKQAIGAMLIAGGAFGLFVACSTTGNSCVVEGDCGADQVCEDSLCTDKCNTNTDCATGTCEKSTEGAYKVCKEKKDDQTNNKTNNTTNNTNVKKYKYFMLQDITTGDGCTSKTKGVGDPGSDIMWVSLDDSTGTALTYAETVVANYDDTTNPDNGYIDDSILDGKPPSVDAVRCVDKFDDTNVYSMGCSGTLIFKFKTVGSDAPYVGIGGEHSVVVGEYGSTCDGSPDDKYEVYGCEDDVKALAGDVTGCTELIAGSGEGITPFPISK